MSLVLEQVTKEYGARQVLSGIDLHMEPGDRLRVTGMNGSGKSTLLQVAATALRPTSGRVVVQGIDASRAGAKARRHIGYAPQTPALYPDLTPLEHLRYAARLHRRGDPELVARRMGLGAAADQVCRTLSGGQRQRTSLALALLHEPPVLLLDEPETGLDPDGRDRLAEALDAHDGILLVAAPGRQGLHMERIR